ncbi:carbohydrate ABC transporter permease [Psychrobacillus sp. NEAU-3TGS]|uniref:carbohydrate ABC transporter permease n=1 Tax=Psychrobacillus sp. NEAU-3TGS TaxID=2995412 RepID=UPI002495F9E4|nr:carbohydrate ABC transporter permease [Psychrobacillus sp. NEAU-3TGS]MDI2587185.1 carbohydrate ABC transporter permease [Psychrobacillus sp. NEAU-3TGS]
MKKNSFNGLNKLIIYVLLTIFAVVSLLPLYWVFSTSLQLSSYQSKDMERPISYVDANPPKMYPMGIPLYFEHWSGAREAKKADNIEDEKYHREMMEHIVDNTFSSFKSLFQKHDIGKWFFNSLYISVVVTFGILLIDSMAGYVLAKKKFPGRNLIFWIIISTMMIPGQVTLVPLFMMIRDLELMDTHWALILPDLSMVFGVFLMRQFMYSIPDELLEAARMDGASEWRTFWTVVLPLAKPGLAALGIFTFMNVWNSFLWPIIVLNSAELYTLPVGLKTLQDANLASFKLLMSGATVAAIPMIIVFILFQRYFVKGLTIGGVKE